MRRRFRRGPVRPRRSRCRGQGPAGAVQPRAPRCPGRRPGDRGRRGDPDPDPGRVLPCLVRLRAARGRRLRGGHGLLRRRAAPGHPGPGPAGRRGGTGHPRLARSPVRHHRLRRRRPGGAARRAPAVRRGRRGPARHGARADGVLPAQAGRARGRGVFRQPVRPDHRVQGHAVRRSAGPVLPGPVRPRVHLDAGAGALPVLHQHVPVLAAGPPLPVRGPQRRDQHRPGQPQLDAGPGGHAGQRPHPALAGRARGSSACSPSSTERPATRPASTSAWNCCTWAAARCRTRC